ncbi:hypothetical protein FRC19_002493 [Serendipita sp. 401]|nr:hypothetical protein FRC19_002493 [Serendipita sp. 401]
MNPIEPHNTVENENRNGSADAMMTAKRAQVGLDEIRTPSEISFTHRSTGFPLMLTCQPLRIISSFISPSRMDVLMVMANFRRFVQCIIAYRGFSCVGAGVAQAGSTGTGTRTGTCAAQG